MRSFFTPMTAANVIKHKLIEEFDLDLDYVDDPSCSFLEPAVIYERLKRFKTRQKAIFQWFKKSFLPEKVYVPIYATALDFNCL